MQNDSAISVEHLSKRYMIGGKQHQWSIRDTVEEFLHHPFGIGADRHDKEEFWALNDISFEIKKGDVVGIIGRNGSGKSTLLKILARIVEPTKGKITMRGRVASLLEVGTGFNPELTGRENIFLNGAILGMSQKEIAGKFDEIVAFSGVEQFIDTPVKRYSSGMYVRLAFAVAAHLDSDILLVDEVLAVGDTEFQKKCLGKMKDLASGGKTVLFVSHDMNAVSSLCKNVFYLDQSRLMEQGKPNDTIRHYLYSQSNLGSGFFEYKNDVSKEIQITKISITSNKGVVTTKIPISEPFKICVHYVVNKPAEGIVLSLFIKTDDGNLLLLSSDSDLTAKSKNYTVGSYSTIVTIPPFLFNVGQFYIDFSLHRPYIETISIKSSILIEILDINNPKSKVFKGNNLGKIASIFNYRMEKLT